MPNFDFYDLSRFTKVEQFEIAVRHAIKTGRKFEEKAVTDHRRKLLVELEKPRDAFEEYFWMHVILYEEVLSKRSQTKRNVKAIKTRQAVKKMSIQDFLVSLMRKQKTQGFRLLSEQNRHDAAYENVIIEFKEMFSETPDVVEIAQKRLDGQTQTKHN